MNPYVLRGVVFVLCFFLLAAFIIMVDIGAKKVCVGRGGKVVSEYGSVWICSDQPMPNGHRLGKHFMDHDEHP